MFTQNNRIIETKEYVQRQKQRGITSRSKQQGNPRGIQSRAQTPQQRNQVIKNPLHRPTSGGPGPLGEPPSKEPNNFNLISETSKILGHRVILDNKPTVVTAPATTDELPMKTEKALQETIVQVNTMKDKQINMNIQLLSFRTRLDKIVIDNAFLVTKTDHSPLPQPIVFCTALVDNPVFKEPRVSADADDDALILASEQVSLQYPSPPEPDNLGNYWIRVYRLFETGELQSFWTIFRDSSGKLLFENFTFSQRGSV